MRYTLAVDMKVANLLLGLQCASSTFPCPWCETHRNDFGGEDKTGNLRTFGNIRQNASQYQEAASNYNRKQQLSATEYKSCVHPPLLDFPSSVPVLAVVPPMELHILLGVVNRLFNELNRQLRDIAGCDLEADDWARALNANRASYHGGDFNGNQCCKLLQGLDVLDRMLQDCEAFSAVPIAFALRCFRNVKDSCFGCVLQPDYKQRIEQFQEAYKVWQLSSRTGRKSWSFFTENRNFLWEWLNFDTDLFLRRLVTQIFTSMHSSCQPVSKAYVTQFGGFRDNHDGEQHWATHQCQILRKLWRNCNETLLTLNRVNGDPCLSRSNPFEWHKQFKENMFIMTTGLQGDRGIGNTSNEWNGEQRVCTCWTWPKTSSQTDGRYVTFFAGNSEKNLFWKSEDERILSKIVPEILKDEQSERRMQVCAGSKTKKSSNVTLTIQDNSGLVSKQFLWRLSQRNLQWIWGALFNS